MQTQRTLERGSWEVLPVVSGSAGVLVLCGDFEMKKYPKITFSLTDEQREELASFEASVRKGSMLDESGDTRCAVMGNVWLAGDKYGTVDVYLMNIESYKLINDAIAEARKFIK